jgi:hypothetical protein
MEQTTTTVSSSKSKYFVIITLCIVICLIIIISIYLLTTIKSRQSSSIIKSLKLISNSSTTTTTTTTLSPEEIHRLSSFKKFLNLPINHPNPNPSHSSIIMNKFMRSVYQQIYDEIGFRRKKRQENFYLSDETDFIISLPNQYSYSSRKNNYHFEYNSSLEYLIYAELILPIDQISTIHLSSSIFNISINSSFKKTKNWFKINLTKYIKSFPLTFQTNSLFSSGFLTLYFRRSSSSISRRDLSSFYDNQLITYPDDPSYCQVRPLRTSFSELNWSSWIIEPSSYEMNICSGTCHTQSNMGTYFLIQNLLNQKYPRKIPPPCCKPKRFSSTILLYYDGPNLVLKRHENMRVVECGCSS